MQFDKPKVTIDLEEYQHLKERVAGMDADEMVLAAKEIIASLIIGNSLGQAMAYMQTEKGILLSVINRRTTALGNGRISANDICISKIKPNDKR